MMKSTAQSRLTALRLVLLAVLMLASLAIAVPPSQAQVAVGSITIVKEANPQSEQEFVFRTSIGGPNRTFQLKDNGTDPNSITFNDLPPNAYNVFEQVPTGWTLDPVQCSGGADISISGPNVTIYLSGGEDVTCTFTNEAKPGRIVIEKVAPDNQPQFEFSQTVDNSGNFNLTGGSSKLFVDVDPFGGPYTVTELDPNSLDYTLADLGCSDDDSTVDKDNRTATINVDPGELVTCSFTNVPQAQSQGHIFVIKDTAPAGGTGFDFEFSDDNNSVQFTLDDLEAAAFDVLTDGGPYTITELDPGPDYVLTDIVCFSEGDFDVTIDRDVRNVTVNLDSDEASVGCIFTNEKLVDLTIVKSAVGGDDTFEFEKGVNSVVDFADFSLTTQGGTAQKTLADLPADFIEIIEVENPAWELAGVECEGVTDGAWITDQFDRLRITPTPGDDITCTFTNENLGSITILKEASPDDDTEFTFRENISNPQSLTDFILKDPSDTTKLFGNLPAGDYSVQELVPSGWDDEPDIRCEKGDDLTTIGVNFDDAQVFIGLAAGDDVVCTFTNEKLGPGGPGVQPIPALSSWGLALLTLLMPMLAMPWLRLR